MSKAKHNSIPHFYNILLYICGLFLFLEWLYPIEQVTDTDSITVFVIYAIFCFFISMLYLPWWASFLLKGFGLIFILNGLYFDMTFLSKEWFQQLAFEVVINIDILISQDLYYLTAMFRSFLFLLLIWLMSYLLHYWFVQMKRIFLFILLTFIYITVLDTFTLYDAKFAIIRIFVISLAALAMTNFNRELERENMSFKEVRSKTVWISVIISAIAFSVLIGMFAPKFDPQWPDPVPFIESAAEQVSGSSGAGSVRKVGYGEDDSRLGGSFIQDDTPVFTVEASQNQYWRIETKDVYTGKGWEAAEESVHIEQLEERSDRTILGGFHPDVETEELTAEVTFQPGQNFTKLVYPYGIKEITDMSPHDDVYFLVDYATEAVKPHQDGEEVKLDDYHMIYDHPSFSLTALREETNDPFDMSHYLQLPDTLPDRVGELAREITESYDTRYDKARAIERYFSSNEFRYQTTDVAVPGEGEDYVDQFLFETKVGYCDNFSTSMVVMLRSLDIPARWVKGFTGGEVVGEGNKEGHQIYEVTNENAHSWVEVFFPETGWVSFEPTQGFTNLTDFHVETTETDTEEYDDVLDIPEEELPETDIELEEEETEPAMGSTSGGNGNISWWQVGIFFAVILIAGFILYKKRLKIITKLYDIRLGRTKNEQVFQDAYHHLLAVLDEQGYERKENQTLREFAKRIDGRFSTDAMEVLTDHYERLLYRNEFNPMEINKLKTLWKKMINTIQ